MVIDIKNLISNLPKPDIVNWYIYKDSQKQDLFFKKEDDGSGNYFLEVSMDVTKDYYLFLELKANSKIYKLGPLLISYIKRGLINSNGLIDTPFVSIVPNLDDDGNLVSLTFSGSDYKGVYDYSDSIWKIKESDNVITVITKNKSITVDASKLKKSIVYQLEMIYRDVNGLSSNINTIYFTINDNSVDYYYVVDNSENLVDKIVEYYLDKSKLVNDVVADNVLVNLVIKEINTNIVSTVDSIKGKYANGEDISEDLDNLRDRLVNIMDNININEVSNKTIVEIINTLKEKYNV